MPLFSNSSPFDGDVEKATSEMNTEDDWALIMDICDKIQRTTNGAKDGLKSIVKRLNHKVPHVAMQALTLLDACVNNCGREFHLEMASRDFVSECRTLIGSKAHPKVAGKLKQLIKKWAEADFKSDPALALIPSLYGSLQADGQDFPLDEHDGMDVDRQPKTATSSYSKDPDVVHTQQEEDDIAKAIQLSLQEAQKDKTKTQPSLYPTVSSMPSSSSHTQKNRDLRKVRALYDFEAAEDNELTFKAGEIISVLDDSDPNWWKGTTYRGEGLFPANFVTADLTVEPEETPGVKEKKSVQFNEEVEVKTVEPEIPEVTEIDEEKIDRVLTLIQNADPTGETNPDLPEMLSLEEQCKAMGPLIDQELERIDRKHASLMELNSKVVGALQMYHSLMNQLPTYGYASLKSVQQPYSVMPPGAQPQMFNGQPQYAAAAAGHGPPMPHGHGQLAGGPVAAPPSFTQAQTMPTIDYSTAQTLSGLTSTEASIGTNAHAQAHVQSLPPQEAIPQYPHGMQGSYIPGAAVTSQQQQLPQAIYSQSGGMPPNVPQQHQQPQPLL